MMTAPLPSNRSGRRRGRRALAATGSFLALTALAAGPMATVASAAQATGTYDGVGAGYAGVYDDQPVEYVDVATGGGSDFFNIPQPDGSVASVEGFCIDYLVPRNNDATVKIGAASELDDSIANLDRVRWLVANAATVGTPLADANAEGTSIQTAIWMLTNADTGISTDWFGDGYTDMIARTQELYDAAQGPLATLPEPISDYELVLSSAADQDAGTGVVTAVVTDNFGDAAPGVTVTFGLYDDAADDTASDEQTAVTDENGEASVSYPLPDGTEVEVRGVTEQLIIDGGTVIVPVEVPGNEEAQPFIAVDPTAVLAESVTALPAQEVPTPPTTTPPTTAPPVTAPPTTAPPVEVPAPPPAAPPVTELPFTGPETGLLTLAGGAVAVAAGVTARRKFRR